MKVLITGGAGFIGSHLVASYLENGDEVCVIDNLSTGSIENIRLFQEDNRFKNRYEARIGSVMDRELMSDLVARCDVVFHLAAAVGVKYIIDHPLRTIQSNIHGTEAVLELCSKFNKRLLIASTSEVYGKHTHAPLRESDNVIYGPSTTPRWCYAATKLIDEFMALSYHRKMGSKIIIVRLFNTIGPRQSGTYGMVVPRFISQALADELITIYGTGNQTRTFTFVGDTVRALMLLMRKDEALGQVFNIGGREEITIRALAEKIIAITGSNSNMAFIPYSQIYGDDFEDMQRRVPCTAKLKSITGFEPKTELDGILKRCIEYIRPNKAGQLTPTLKRIPTVLSG